MSSSPIRIFLASQDLHAQKPSKNTRRQDKQTDINRNNHEISSINETPSTQPTRSQLNSGRQKKRESGPVHSNAPTHTVPIPSQATTKQHNPMTILPLSSTPGRNTPTQQSSSYFPSQEGGPTIGIPGQDGGAFGRRKSDGGHGFGFGGSNSSGRVHRGGINGGGVSNFVPLFLRRLFRFPHMDFQVKCRRFGHLNEE